jgi:porphobilinogen synthase
MVQETALSAGDLIMPLFVRPGSGVRKEIESRPGNYQLSPDTLVDEVKSVQDAGVPAIILFGIPSVKDAVGSEAYSDTGIICHAIEGIKKACPGMCVITDVCLCEYTDHGHCGVVKPNRDGVPDVDNDATLELLVKESLAHARAGADMIAPSDMMDGRVAAIREALDAEGMTDIP